MKAIENIDVLNNTPKPVRKFRIGQLKRFEADTESIPETIEVMNEDDEHILYNPSTGTENTLAWKRSFQLVK